MTANASFYYPLAKEIKSGHPVMSGERACRTPRDQQWGASRNFSYPFRTMEEDQLSMSGSTVIRNLEVIELSTGKSESGHGERFKEGEVYEMSVVHVETSPCRVAREAPV